MNGWVKIHRNIMEWQWYGNPEMVALWLHLILTANHADGMWRGVPVKRGQVVTSRNELARRTGLSERVVRTCLRRLQMTNDVTIKATNKYSIITICEYDIYQSFAPTNDQQSDQQNDQQTPTNKNIRIKEDNLCCDNARARLEDSTIYNSLWMNQTSMALHTPDVMELAVEVMDEWEVTQLPTEEWTVHHLFNHIRKKLAIRKSETKPTKQEEKNEWRSKMLQSIHNDLIYGNSTKQ